MYKRPVAPCGPSWLLTIDNYKNDCFPFVLVHWDAAVLNTAEKEHQNLSLCCPSYRGHAVRKSKCCMLLKRGWTNCFASLQEVSQKTACIVSLHYVSVLEGLREKLWEISAQDKRSGVAPNVPLNSP